MGVTMTASIANNSATLSAETVKSVVKGYSPYIGANGNWYEYDPSTKNFIDTGVKAKGEQGVKGDAGERGSDGYTPIKNVDYFDGKDGKDGRNGVDGRDGQDGQDYVLTDADKTEIAEEASELVPQVDVQINGTSIVEDGVANIPIASNSSLGLVRSNSQIKVDSSNGTISFSAPKSYGMQWWGGDLGLTRITPQQIDGRSANDLRAINVGYLDYAVKSALCDGKGAAYTDAEKASARERIGENRDYVLIAEGTTEEDVKEVVIAVDFSKYKKIWWHVFTTNTNGASCVYRFGIRKTITSGSFYITYDSVLLDYHAHFFGYLEKQLFIAENRPNVFDGYYATCNAPISTNWNLKNAYNRAQLYSYYQAPLGTNTNFDSFGAVSFYALTTDCVVKAGTSYEIWGIEK